MCELSFATGEPDYTLFVDGKALGTVEAKPAGHSLVGVEEQSIKYVTGVPASLPAWHNPLPFCYESTGNEIRFTNRLDPDPRSRNVFAFHRPETLFAWAQQEKQLARRLQEFPALTQGNLWPAQFEAIKNLEVSLIAGRPRALIQMATGSGKTFTAVNFIYRLVKYAGAKRVLFLVDRGNLGEQTLKEFQQFVSPVNNYKFTEEYIVQRLSSNQLDTSARVVIGTIQRVYSMLQGEQAPAPDLDDLPIENMGLVGRVPSRGVPGEQSNTASRDAAYKDAPFESGEALLARILTERRQNWQGRGKYKEPAAPDTANLPPLPDGWTWARLEQLGLTFGGLTKNPKRAKLPKHLPYLRVANVYANELRLEEMEQIGVADSELDKLLVRAGDLLIVEGNGSKDQIGRLAIWDGSIDSCVHQNHLIKVRPVDSRMPKWILHWLQSPGGRQFVELVASSTSGLFTLSVNKVGNLVVPLPPLAEQTRIVAEVERRLSVVAELESVVSANLQRATRLRQSILQKAFTGQLA